MSPLNTPIGPPIVIDLGKQRRGPIKELKRGRGKLVDRVHDVVERVRGELGADAAGKHLVPVVVLYRKKERKRRGLRLPLPLPFGG